MLTFFAHESPHISIPFRAYEQATKSTAMTAPWVKTGFQCEEKDNAQYITVNEAAIRSSKSFRDILGFDHVLDRLPARRQSQK
jgi:hypothetical protein